MEKRILRQPAADVARSGVTDATLHQAILDDPDDIAARRVYADALIAAGDPRGELINVQCAFEDAIPTERGALLARETALLKAHAKAWMAPFAGAIFRPEFRRGFVEHAYVNPKKFLPVARALLDAEPITSLHMRALSGAGAGLLGQVPGLARLRTLGVTESKLATKGTAALFANPLPRLTTLRLYQAGIDDGALDALRPLFPQLQRLDLAGTRLTYDGLATVLADPTVAVRYLRLDGLTPGTDGASFLAEHLALPKLTHLDLSSPATRCFAACAGSASSTTTSREPPRSRRSGRCSSSRCSTSRPPSPASQASPRSCSMPPRSGSCGSIRATSTTRSCACSRPRRSR